MSSSAPTSAWDSISSSTPVLARAIASGAGDWSSAVVREVHRVLGESSGRRPAALAVGIDELRARGLVRDEETRPLKQLIDAFFRVARGKAEPGADRETVLDLHVRLSTAAEASPAAVAIASVAARHVVLAGPKESGAGVQVMALSATITPGSTGAGAVVGAVIGAAVGGAVGGWVGAGIGALVGAAAGAAVGFSNEENV